MLTRDRLAAAAFITAVVVGLLLGRGVAPEGILLALSVLGMAAALLLSQRGGDDDPQT